MARLLTAPIISLSTTLGPSIFKLKSEIEGKVGKEVESIADNLSPDICNNERELLKIKNQLSNLKSFLDQAENRVNKFSKVVDPIRNLLIAVSAGIVVLELLPVPNIGTTVGVTSKFAELLINLRKLSNELNDEITLLTGILVGTSGIQPLITKSKDSLIPLDRFIKNCSEETFADTPLLTNPEDTLTSNFLEEYLGYRIQVQVVDESNVAPLRKVIATDRLGIIRFSSSESFSANKDVLVKEVKFKIDNNILS